MNAYAVGAKTKYIVFNRLLGRKQYKADFCTVMTAFIKHWMIPTS